MALKHVNEYRDSDLAGKLIRAIHALHRKPLRLMEVCGTHTMAIFRHGIRSVLPRTITLVSGPGCPVCVTSQQDIDIFVALAREKDVVLTTFGDLMRVPGTVSSLQQERARGRDIRVVYSVADALAVATAHPRKEVVFCAVGFETTTPTVAAALVAARGQGIDNFSIHCAHKCTPPALEALMARPDVAVDGFLLPGHVSVITGTGAYAPLFRKYRVPSVIAGFEPVDILCAVHMLVKQHETAAPALENGYPRAVAPEGNPRAREMVEKVFAPAHAVWRGIGPIADSGLCLGPAFGSFNACERFNVTVDAAPEPPGCACGEILMGLKTPEQCPLYKRKCTPMHPVGPCMVSSEGTCAAFYRYS